MNIALVGMMGSGKTTVARKLARQIGYQILDTDDQIEKDQGCSVEQIFLYTGEGFFRDLENKKLKELLTIKNTVLATGGGIVLRQENWDYLRQIGKVVYLQASVEKIFDRLKGDSSRPLLKTADPLQKLKDLLAERENFYLQADLVLPTDHLDLNHICHKIIQTYRLGRAENRIHDSLKRNLPTNNQRQPLG